MTIQSLLTVTLRGEHVQLEPFTESHIPVLWAAVTDNTLFQYMPFPARSEAEFSLRVRQSIAAAEGGRGVGMVQRALADTSVAGATEYLYLDLDHRRTEIGGTWLTPRWQRTAINTEAKLLMMTHAFETWSCIRVEFKTDSLNERSRAALNRIGAREEGTFRNHMIMPDGRFRHSTYYSVIDTEWPSVKARLQQRLRPPSA